MWVKMTSKATGFNMFKVICLAVVTSFLFGCNNKSIEGVIILLSNESEQPVYMKIEIYDEAGKMVLKKCVDINEEAFVLGDKKIQFFNRTFKFSANECIIDIELLGLESCEIIERRILRWPGEILFVDSAKSKYIALEARLKVGSDKKNKLVFESPF